ATPAPTPATVSPYHATAPLQAAPTQPVILFRDGADRSQVDGVTWDGQAAGRVGTAAPSEALDVSPQGTLYRSGAAIRDRSGSVVASVALDKTTYYWADDGRHYCRIASASPPPPSGTPATLQLDAPGEASRDVARLGT